MSAIGLIILVWVARQYDVADLRSVVADADVLLLGLTLPIVLVNMGVRAVRWRTLMGRDVGISPWQAFSAIMIGNLGNVILPARVGDLVRILALGASGALTRSRILASVVAERLLDMGTILILVAWLTIIVDLPTWLQRGGLVMGAGAVTGLLVVIKFRQVRETVVAWLVRATSRWLPAIASRLGMWVDEFGVGVREVKSWRVIVSFGTLTVVIWLLETALLIVVARAFGLNITVLAAIVLMVFSLFSSLIPALPGQIGTFEFAMLMGLTFLGIDDPAILPFAVTAHVAILLWASVIGVTCLVVSQLTWSDLRAGPTGSAS